MSKFETPKGKYEQYFAKPKRKAGELKGLEEIAKESLRNIPENWIDEVTLRKFKRKGYKSNR